MKVKFSRSVPFVPKWRGNDELPEAEQVKAVLMPLETDDLFVLMDTLGGAKAASEVGYSQMKNVVKEVGHLVPKQVKLTGLEDDDGAVDEGNLCQFPFYMDLAVELIMQLATISMPTEADVKN